MALPPTWVQLAAKTTDYGDQDINLKGPLTGWDVAKRARELHPELPVVYMTGDSADKWPSHGVPNSLLLNKPFAPAQIVTAVAQLLNAAKAVVREPEGVISGPLVGQLPVVSGDGQKTWSVFQNR